MDERLAETLIHDDPFHPVLVVNTKMCIAEQWRAQIPRSQNFKIPESYNNSQVSGLLYGVVYDDGISNLANDWDHDQHASSQRVKAGSVEFSRVPLCLHSSMWLRNEQYKCLFLFQTQTRVFSGGAAGCM